MEKFILIFLPLIFAVTIEQPAKTEDLKSEEMAKNSQEPTIYYFIRHAEKDLSDPNTSNPALSQVGKDRAQNWALVFKDLSFDLIYSSDFIRTRSTAQAIADSQQKEVQIYDARKLNDKEFQEKTKGKKVLVVGHSNTNPQFVNLILGENKYQDIPDEESGSLFIVTVFPNGGKHSQVLYIN